jgi:hypothetical protein
MAFVYDAIDGNGEVGKELRRKNPDPHFNGDHQHLGCAGTGDWPQAVRRSGANGPLEDTRRHTREVGVRGREQLKLDAVGILLRSHIASCASQPLGRSPPMHCAIADESKRIDIRVNV